MPEWIVINKDGLDANLRFTNAPCAATSAVERAGSIRHRTYGAYPLYDCKNIAGICSWKAEYQNWLQSQRIGNAVN